MIHTIRLYIEKYRLLSEDRPVLVGLSGGADSVALLGVLVRLGYPCIALHCNFHLRGEESDRDEAFACEFAESLEVPFHKIDFDTISYAGERHLSIEMAARELRYAWFEEMRERLGGQATAVAQKEANDAQVASQLEIAQKQTDLAKRQAALKVEADTEKAKADAAYEIQSQIQRRDIERETAQADIVKQEQQAVIKEKEVVVTKQALQAEVNAKADADRYAAENEGRRGPCTRVSARPRPRRSNAPRRPTPTSRPCSPRRRVLRLEAAPRPPRSLRS